MDNIKLFEELDREGMLDPSTLSRGKKAALARGDDLLSKSQYAACYLNAIERLGRREDTRRAGDSTLTRTALNIVDGDDSSEDWRKISGAKLSVYLNLKPQTVERTISKFAMMLDGNMEGTPSNALYPEIINYFKEFEAAHPSDVLAIAEEALDYNADDSFYQEYLETQRESGAKTREKKKVTADRLSRDIRSTFLNLYSSTNDMDQSARMTAFNLAKMNNLTKQAIAILAMKEFSKEPTLQKAWRKIR